MEKVHHQYVHGCEVQRGHTISTDEIVQCRSAISSVRTRGCSTELPKLLRGLLVVEFILEDDL